MAQAAPRTYLHNIPSIHVSNPAIPAILGNLDLNRGIQTGLPVDPQNLVNAKSVAKGLRAIHGFCTLLSRNCKPQRRWGLLYEYHPFIHHHGFWSFAGKMMAIPTGLRKIALMGVMPVCCHCHSSRTNIFLMLMAVTIIGYGHFKKGGKGKDPLCGLLS